MGLRGIFASHASLIGDRQTDLAGRVLRIGAGGMAPMLAISSGMPSAPTTDTSFGWIEDTHISGNAEVVTGGNSAAVSIVVDDSNIWVPNSILMNESTGEYMLVTSLNADGVTVGILRGFAGTTAAAIVAGQKLQSIGTAHAEGSGKPNPVTTRGSERTNYVQIFKNGWAITGTARKVKYLTGNQMATNREQCLNFHAEDIERAFLWGRKSVSTVDNKQLRTSNGIIPQIEGYGGIVESANSNATAGQLNLKDLRNFLRRLFDKQAKGLPNERIGFCGSQLLELIQNMVLLDSTYNVTQNETGYGLKVTTITGFNGDLKLLTHPMMVENAKWQQELYVLHPGLIKKRVLRETWSEEFGPEKNNNNGVDATEGYIADELGFEVKGVACMGVYKNIQTAGKSFP